MTIEILAQEVETQNKRIDALEKLIATLTTQDKKAKKKAKKEKTDDAEEPKKKKAKSGYILFSTDVEMRDKAKQKLSEESDEQPKSTRIMSTLGTMWKALSEDERDVWKQKAKEQA